MSQKDFIAQRWLKAFLHHRRLEAPDGRPLFRYNCSAAEHDDLKGLLKGAKLAVDNGRNIAAAFVLHAAECFRKDHVDGAWTWRTALEPIGQVGSTMLCQPLKDLGLSWWKRPTERQLHGRKLHMFTLVSEGGFPTGLLMRERTAVRGWLSRLLQYAAIHDADIDQCSAAAQEFSGILPQSLVNDELNQLGAELALAVKALRSHVSDTSAEDPLLALSAAYPGWRNEVPLQLDDGAARELLRGLVSLKLDAPLDRARFLCRRGLLQRAGQWLPSLRIEQEGQFRIDQISMPAREMIGATSYRARLIAAGALAAARDGEIALLEKEDAGWQFRALPRAAGLFPFPFEADASVQIRLAGRYSEPFIVMGGAGVESDVFVFRRVSDDELTLVGTGSLVTSDESAFVAVTPGVALLNPQPGCVLTYLGMIGDSGIVLHEVQGECRISGSDGSTLRIATGVGTDSTPFSQITIIPRSPSFHVTPQPASLGLPRFLKSKGLSVANKDIQWRRADTVGDKWKSLEAHAPLGAVRFQVVRDGDVVERFRSTILPETAVIGREFRDARGGRILLSGFLARDLVVRQESGVQSTIQQDDGNWVIELDANPQVTRVGIRLHFTAGGYADLELDIPRRGACFVDADGRMLPRDCECSIDELAGIRLLSDNNRLLAVDVRSKSYLRRGSSIPVSGSLPLSGLVQEFRAALAETSDQDASLVLEAEQARLRLRRYAFDLRRLPDGRIVAALPSPNALRGQIVRVVALPLRDPSVGEKELWSGDGADLADLLLASPDATVPWLCFVERRGRAISRPSVFLGNTPASDEDEFGRCADLPTYERRISAMSQHLSAIAGDPGHRDWVRLRTALQQSQGRLALASLDWFAALAAQSNSLAAILIGASASDVTAVLEIENELPFLWETIPLDAWLKAATARRTALMNLLREHGVNLADAILSETLEAIAQEKRHLHGLMTIVARTIGLALRHENTAPLLEDPTPEFLIRNAGRNWPLLKNVSDLLPSCFLQKYSKEMAPAVYAPSIAQDICFGRRKINPNILIDLRTSKRFDQMYFENKFGRLGR